MGRPALPANVHQLRGNPSKKNLAALLDETIRPDVALPQCPKHLDDEAKKEWTRIGAHLKALGLISEIDRAALAGYCTAWSDFVWASRRIAELNGERDGLAADATGERGRIWDTPSGYKQISVPMQIRNRAMEQMHKWLAEFGMSPAARTRVTASDPQLGLPGMDKPQEGGWGAFPKQPQQA
jgi:P27 family predicted phage terminase small subunit